MRISTSPLLASAALILVAPAIMLAVSFNSPKAYLTGFKVSSVAVGDFNGDGKLDVAVGTALDPYGTGTDNVQVFLGDGDGTFTPGVTMPVAASLMAVADVKGDGKLDLLALGLRKNGTGETEEVTVLLGNGDGAFQAPIVTVVIFGVASMAVADFNGDGKPDLAIAGAISSSEGGAAGYTMLLLGNGDGTFRRPITVSNVDAVESAAPGDFNGDGKTDLAVTVVYGDGANVSILLGNGDGTFQPPVNYPVSFQLPNLPQIAVGDFNGDGIPDLAATDSATVSVLLGRSDGTFRPAVTSALAS